MASDTAHHASTGAHGDDHGHHEPGFWGKYVFSTDHKVIGIQYGLSALVFMFCGMLMMLLMRFKIAWPTEPMPWVGELLKDPALMPGGSLSPDFYNSLGAMHGTVMVFLAVVPLGFAAFGNYLVPLQIGAPDMAFPRINMASFWSFLPGGVVMLLSFFLPGGAAKSGWTSYPPLSVIADPAHPETIAFFAKFMSAGGAEFMARLFNGQTMWLIGMVLLITSSLLGSVNFIATVIQLRAKGMTWFRMPFLVWAMFVTAFLLLLAFPPLEAAGIMQLMDRVAGTSFFMPSGLAINNNPATQFAGGGSPVLWQHLFWFLGHPEVYVIILPAFGVVAEVITNNIRKPLWGYKAMVYSACAVGFISFIVWAHHMYLTGMGTKITTFFQTTTVLISVPSVILLSSLFVTLWGGSIRINTASLFALAFLPMFGIGGLTGLPLAFSTVDIYLHDTYYVIAHFHYVVAPGTIFGLLAGIYHWFPKITGRRMSEFWGRVHFWPTLVAINVIFMPMFIQGMAGMHRRMSDGGKTYDLNAPVLHWNVVSTYAAFTLAVFQLPFIVNLFWSIFAGKKVTGENPAEGTTLEWATPTPPGHGNFDRPITVHRDPYEYSVPGHASDFSPQWLKDSEVTGGGADVPAAEPVPVK
jgi:cytochrome c oxidase subunit 1